MRYSRQWASGFLASFFLALAGPAAGLDVSGAISSNATWRLTDSPIRVVGDVEVIGNARLTIEAGVRVEFLPNTRLDIRRGALIAVGTVVARIEMTSASTNPVPGDWGPLKFHELTFDDVAQLAFVDVRYGNGIAIERSSPRISHTHLSHHAGPAISIDLESSPVGIGLTATDNGLNGILVPAGTIVGSVRWGLVGIPYVVQQGAVIVGLPPLTLTPPTADVRVGATRTYTVGLAKAAPAGGWTFDVVSSAPSTASVPAMVTIPAGATSTTFDATGVDAGQATIAVSRLELGAAASSLTVLPPIALRIDPPDRAVGVGEEAFVTVRSDAPISGAPVEVAIESSVPGIVDVPASVILFTNQSSASIPVTGIALGTTTLTVSAPGFVAGTSTISVQSRFLRFGPLGIVRPGQTAQIEVQSSEAAPAGGLPVTLTSASPSVATIAPLVTIAEGTSSTFATVQGIARGQSTVTASSPGFQPGSASIVVDDLALGFEPTGPVTIPRGLGRDVLVRINRPAPAGGLTVTVSASSSNATVAPSIVTIPEGTLAASNVVRLTGAIDGPSLIRATAAGALDGNLSVTVSTQPQLVVNGPNPIRVARGFAFEIGVTRSGNSGPLAYAEPVVVTLSATGASRVSFPAVVTIPAGQSEARFRLVGVVVGAATLTASATGYTPSSARAIEVGEPRLFLSSLDTQRIVGAARDDFSVRLDVANGFGQLAPVDIDIGVATSAANPPNVIEGIFPAISGGNLINTVRVRTGTQISTAAFVGSPTAAGTYQIAANLPSAPSVFSDTQTVVASAPRLEFDSEQTSISVGRGLRRKVPLYLRHAGVPVALANDLPISLQSSTADVTVPSVVILPAGESSIEIPIDGVALGAAEVSASAPDVDPTEQALNVEVVEASLRFDQFFATSQIIGTPRVPVSLIFDDGVSNQDRSVMIELIERDPENVVPGLFAEATGATALGPWQLSEDSPQPTNSAGGPYFYVGSANEPGSYRLRVSIPGIGQWTSELVEVSGDEFGFNGGTPLVIGRDLTSTAMLVSRIGLPLEQALTIVLTNPNPAALSMPATVTLPAHQSAVTVPIRGLAASDWSTVEFTTVERPDLSSSFDVQVIEPVFAVEELADTRGVAGERDSVYVRWHVPGSYDQQQFSDTPVNVQLALVDRTPAGIVDGIFSSINGAAQDAQLTIPAGQASSLVAGGGRRYIGSPQATGSYRVRSSAAGIAPADSVLQSVVMPAYQFSDSVAFVGRRLRAEVPIRRIVAGRFEPAGSAVELSLSTTASGLIDVPSSVTLLPGHASVAVPTDGVTLGALLLRATAPGFDAAETEVRVVTPRLMIGNVPASLSVGQAQSISVRLEVPISATLALENQRPSAPLTVDLTSAVPSVATIVPQLVIPPTASGVDGATLNGLAPGFTTISVSATGLDGQTSGDIAVSRHD